MVLTITIFIVDQTTVAIISYNINIILISTIKRQSLSFLTITIFYRRSNDNRYQCNIETISNSRDYYSRFNQLELQNIKSN